MCSSCLQGYKDDGIRKQTVAMSNCDKISRLCSTEVVEGGASRLVFTALHGGALNATAWEETSSGGDHEGGLNQINEIAHPFA